MVSFSNWGKTLPSQTGREITPSFRLAASRDAEHTRGALTFLAGNSPPALWCREGLSYSRESPAVEPCHATPCHAMPPGLPLTGGADLIRVVTSPLDRKSFHHPAVYTKWPFLRISMQSVSSAKDSLAGSSLPPKAGQSSSANEYRQVKPGPVLFWSAP